jgi:hypothetical protein
MALRIRLGSTIGEFLLSILRILGVSFLPVRGHVSTDAELRATALTRRMPKRHAARISADAWW